MKEFFIALVAEAKNKGELSVSQRKLMVKSREKRDRHKRYIKNRRLIFSLNADTKIVSRTFLERLKNVLFGLIPQQKTAYIKKKFTGEGGRLISDIVYIYMIVAILEGS